MVEILKNILDENNNLKPRFSGIGRIRGKQEYTPEEKIVIEYFFTNSDSNVYCATDNMPNELWALAMGQYARSNMTARDRILKLFSDMSEKGEGVKISELAKMIKSGNDVSQMLEKHLNKAGKFIAMWGVKYGHASLRDSGNIRICFEGVSQRATKFLEAAREGAYQEQSTRALPFNMENIGIPYELEGTKHEEKMRQLDEKLIELYQKIYDKLLVHLKDKFSHYRIEADKKLLEETGKDEVKITDREWNSIIAGKAFDVARYLLPQNMTTSLGITLNTRRFQDMLTEWQSSEILEMQVLGKVAQIESMKISPMLMKYGTKSEYFRAIPKKIRNLTNKYTDINKIKDELNNDSINKNDFLYKHYEVDSKLISAPDNLQDMVLASILFNGSDGKLSMMELMQIVEKLTDSEKREIAESVTKDKKSFEIFSKTMECGTLVFERLYDIGAFRDLQRQRGDRQQYNPYSVIGYNMPKEITEIGLQNEFEQMMQEVKEFYDELIGLEEYGAAQYVPVMANILRHVTTKDVVQCFYEAKLRAQPAGIDSYRYIAQQEIKQVLDIMPAFKGLIPYDDKYYDLGRLPETINMKIRKYK